MNCLEFRRAALADPRRLGAEVAAHAAECPACSEFLTRSLELEGRLGAALRIPAPEDLAARLLKQNAVAYRPRWVALAASLLAALGIALVLGWPRSDALALAGIDFVVYDEAQSIADAAPTDLRVLLRVAGEMGVSLPRQLGDIRYVCVYPFVAGAAHHLLVKSPLGKITLLLIPGQPSAARAAGAARGLQAAVLPARTGSVLIVGQSARSVERAARLVQSQ